MYKTLQAETYPNINIALKAVRYPPGYNLGFCEEWVILLASADLTIAGHTRRVHLHIEGKKTGADLFRFKSKLPIQMTDFNISPPTALLGLVKVSDHITIHLDLLVKAKEVG